MSERSTMSWRASRLALGAAVALAFAAVSVALANAGPPSTKVFLRFDYQAGERTTLEGFQLLGCSAPRCDELTLLHGYGTCEAQGCLDSAPALETVQAPDCLGDRCLLNLYSAYEDFYAVKLVGQFADGVRESELLRGQLPSYGTVAWLVAVRDADLVVSEDAKFQSPYAAYDNLVQLLTLTVVAETLVATLIVRGRLKAGRTDLLKVLGYVLLVNLISYPITWVLLPSLGRFQAAGIRSAGYFAAIVVGLCAAPLVSVLVSEGDQRRRRVAYSLLLLVIAAIACLFWLVVITFTGDLIAVHGLPFGLTIALAEAFAVTFEAALVYALARKTLAWSWRRAAGISLAANVTSFLLGRLVLAVWL
jgi:hypothetical protein